jgi:hypothetical protein
MATGPEHYQNAEMLLSEIALYSPEKTQQNQNLLLAAIAHAVLGLAAATAVSASTVRTSGMSAGDYNGWARAASADPVEDPEDSLGDLENWEEL